MSRYWVYLSSQVLGPYELDDLIKVRGFSRNTQVCLDDASGQPMNWKSSADIPELSRIFKVVDQVYEPSLKEPTPKTPPKVVRPHRSGRVTIMPPTVSSDSHGSAWVWAFVALLFIGGGYYRWYQSAEKKQSTEEQQVARAMIENYTLPATSQYTSLNQYFQDKNIDADWQYEHLPTGLYNVQARWSMHAQESQVTYAFEVNLQAQSLRGMNSAAIKLLSDGIGTLKSPSPSDEEPKPAPKPSSQQQFTAAVSQRAQAVEQGDFETVWQSFSEHKRMDMQKAGMSESGFVRLQKLTIPPDSSLQQKVLKMKKESESTQWVLIRQTQSSHPDLLIKQKWVQEDGDWKLDDEEKRSAEEKQASSAATSESSAAPIRVLPGISGP